MHFFPIKEQEFELHNNQTITLERLNRRTAWSRQLISQRTEKSFCGIVQGNHFKLISSVVGSGAFCVLKGEISSNTGFVKVEIHKVFKFLLSAILCFPVIGFIILMVKDANNFSSYLFVITVGQMLMIRYVFIGLAFKFLSNRSLNRLRDVLDCNWV